MKPVLQSGTLMLLQHLRFHTAGNKLPTIRALTEGGAGALSTGCASQMGKLRQNQKKSEAKILVKNGESPHTP